MLGETLTERLLLSRGIPTELIAPIQRMTPDELNESDQFDEQTINSVLSWYRATRRTKAIPIPLPNIGPQQPVTVAQNDVASVSRIPLSKFLARLTPEQQRLVTRRAKGIMAVRGAAGSGKTIVGIRRLVALLEQRELTETKPVLYTCHNRVLATVAESLLRERVENGETRNLIQVTTTYGLMIDELQKRVSDPLPKRAGKERLLPLLTEARELTGRARSLVAWSDAELLTEIIEIIYGRVLLRLSDYAQADRRGVKHAHRLTAAARGADFAPSRSPISVEADHPFRSKPITHFASSRSPVSVEADQGVTGDPGRSPPALLLRDFHPERVRASRANSHATGVRGVPPRV